MLYSAQACNKQKNCVVTHCPSGLACAPQPSKVFASEKKASKPFPSAALYSGPPTMVTPIIPIGVQRLVSSIVWLVSIVKVDDRSVPTIGVPH